MNIILPCPSKYSISKLEYLKKSLGFSTISLAVFWGCWVIGSARVKHSPAQSGTGPTWCWTAPPFNSDFPVFFFFLASLKCDLPAFRTCANTPPISCEYVILPAPSAPPLSKPNKNWWILSASQGSCTILHPSYACNKAFFLSFLFLFLLLYLAKEKPITGYCWNGCPGNSWFGVCCVTKWKCSTWSSVIAGYTLVGTLRCLARFRYNHCTEAISFCWEVHHVQLSLCRCWWPLATIARDEDANRWYSNSTIPKSIIS